MKQNEHGLSSDELKSSFVSEENYDPFVLNQQFDQLSNELLKKAGVGDSPSAQQIETIPLDNFDEEWNLKVLSVAEQIEQLNADSLDECDFPTGLMVRLDSKDWRLVVTEGKQDEWRDTSPDVCGCAGESSRCYSNGSVK